MLKVLGKSDKELESIELFQANRQVTKVCNKVCSSLNQGGGPLKQIPKIIVDPSLGLLWAPAHGFCVTFYVCLKCLYTNSQACHKNQVKVTQNWAKGDARLNWMLSCSIHINSRVVSKRFCENCANILESHMKNHRNTIMYSTVLYCTSNWRQ